MFSRGKKIVNLALDSISTASNTKQDTGEFDNFEESHNEDPWLGFKRWKESQKQEVRQVSDLDQFQNVKNNCTANTEKHEFHDLEAMKISPKVDKNTREFVKICTDGDISIAKSNFENDSQKRQFHGLRLMETSSKPDNRSHKKLGTENTEIEGSVVPDSDNSSLIYSIESWKPSDGDVTDDISTDSYFSESSEITTIQSKVPTKIIRGSRESVEHSRRKGRVWDKKDRCPYCNKDITNFSRHLLRKHADEESVKKIIRQPKKDRQRKFMIDLLRKQGNFSLVSENVTRPVQRPSSEQNKGRTLPSDYLPCKYCKGFYKVKSLRRHAIKCYFNNEGMSRKNFASEGQTMIAFTESRQDYLKKLRLNTEVFNHMHADRISFNGKSDPIICQYAEDYLRKHKRPHIKNAVSNKVRELGRLLIPLQDLHGIKSMIEVLKPENFDKVVSASRIISGYDERTRTFRAPSLAVHMKTILLAVCSSARSLILKRSPFLPISDYDEALKCLKGFRELVDANWKFEMGSLALKDLNEKHSSVPQTLPVTRDIILFRNYTQEAADISMANLKANPNDLHSFKRLTEATLALTIILNRKRIGDVQYTKLDSYIKSTVSSNQEECLQALSDSERELSRHFKRIVTIGKGSRSVPLLFSKRIQEYLKTLLSVRRITTFVLEENPFLFALTGNSSKWVDGSAILRKYAVNCGASNPSTLTSSRLRKQIATVLQILNLNDTEMEQVASFMGHTRKTHEQFYRLPQDVFQTGKVAKLLLMMEKGVGAENQGKTLDEIDVELVSWETLSTDEENSEKNESDEPSGEQMAPTTALLKHSENRPLCDGKSTQLDFKYEKELQHKMKNYKNNKNRKSERGSWNEEQKTIMLKFFKVQIKNKTAPKKAECLKLLKDHTNTFKGKNWVQIKVFIYNTYKNNIL